MGNAGCDADGGTAPQVDDADERQAIYEAMTQLRERRTKLAPEKYHAAMSDDDWIELGMFLVSVVALDEMVANILTTYTEHPEEDVEGASFGKRLDWARKLLKTHGVTREQLQQLFELNELRISVVHRAPSVKGVDEDRTVWLYTYAGKTVEIEDLQVESTRAWLIMDLLRSTDFAALSAESRG